LHLGLGGVVYAVSLIPVLQDKLFDAALIYSLVYFLLLGITFFPDIPYKLRAYSWLAILYCLAIINLIYSGLNVDAGLFFITFVTMTALLLDMGRAIFSVFLSLVSITIAGFFCCEKKSCLRHWTSANRPGFMVCRRDDFFVNGLGECYFCWDIDDELVDKWMQLNKATSLLLVRQNTIEESELNYRTLFEASPDVIVRLDLNGIVVAINRAGEKLLGLSKNKILERNITDFVLFDDRPSAIQLFKEVLQGDDIYDAGLRFRLHTGTIVFIEFSLAKILNKKNTAVGLIAVGKDVSEKVRVAEIAIAQNNALDLAKTQLSNLARRLILLQEDERRIISRELHDDVGQVLITLQHNLAIVIDECKSIQYSEKILERLQDAVDLAVDAGSIVRATSHNLRPPAFEVGGLINSLEYLCQQISSQTNLKVEFVGEELDFISDELAINLYRFVQEALTNSLKHSAAHKATVRVYKDSHELIISVTDDGEGFKDGIEQNSKPGIGILSLKERLALFQGKLEVDAESGPGFTLTAILPLKKNVS
jgi:PAS domain S-box-containing protein